MLNFIASNIEGIAFAIKIIWLVGALYVFLQMIVTLTAPFTVTIWNFQTSNSTHRLTFTALHTDSGLRQGDKMMWRWYAVTGLSAWGVYSGTFGLMV